MKVKNIGFLITGIFLLIIPKPKRKHKEYSMGTREMELMMREKKTNENLQ